MDHVHYKMVFHGIDINKEEVILDGSEAPVRIDAEALLASEQLAPVATLNKVKYIMLIPEIISKCF